MGLQAVIFDFDGVVIDSHDAHGRSWFLLAEELGESLTREQFTATFGQRNETILPLLGWADPGDGGRIRELGDRKEELYRDILRAEGIEPLPGVVALLEALRAARVPTAIGTSTPRENVRCVLELTGLAGFFAGLAASEDVSRGKPDPEVFLKAAGRLSVAPAGCVVVEDAAFGLRAARAAGMKAVGVTTSHPEARLREERPDAVVASMAELSPDILRALWA